jgi:glycosyltransferase involved in cell wall biosynthesis
MTNPTVVLVIPALDEEAALPSTLARVPQGVRVIVVDNGSRDRTAEVARQGGALVLFQPRRGYGSAVLAAFAALQADPPDVVVIADADGSDAIEQIADLVGPIARGEADLVLCDRTVDSEPGALTWLQRGGNRLATELMRWTTGHRYRDMGPFRALRWTELGRLGLGDPDYGWNVEIQSRAPARGLRILEIPLPHRCRTAGESKVSGPLGSALRAGRRIVVSVWRYRPGARPET